MKLWRDQYKSVHTVHTTRAPGMRHPSNAISFGVVFLATWQI